MTVSLLFLLFLMNTTVAFATDTGFGTPSESGKEAVTNTTTPNNVYNVPDPDTVLDLPNVQAEELVGRINEKGNDVVNIVSAVGKWLCLAGFVACCILIVIGVIGNKRMIAGGLVGMFLSGFMYAAITCGRDIVTWISAWIQA